MARVFEPIDRFVSVALDAISPEARSRQLADFARRMVKEVDAHNDRVAGRDVQYETAVDGRKGAREEDVRPDGMISYEWDLRGPVVDFVWEQLLIHSPVLTGKYRNSHLLFADGVEVQGPQDVPNPDQVSEWSIVNVQPYARKIERGQSDQAPDGVYEGVAALAKNRFGNVAAIKFTYRSLADVGSSALVQWAQTKTPQYKSNKKRRRNLTRQFEKNTRNPAIYIRFY